MQRHMPLARMSIKKNTHSFTLVEVLVAAVIFSIAVAGLFSVFSITRQTSDASERELQAAYLGRQLLEELRAKVDQRNWDPTAPDTWYLVCDGGTYDWPGIPANPLSGFDAGATVRYTCDNLATGARKVTLQITWNEP